jgi:hypothetical protein
MNGIFVATKNIRIQDGFVETAMCAHDKDILFYNLYGQFSTNAYSVYNAEKDSVENIMPYQNFKISKAYEYFSQHPMSYSDERDIDFIMPVDNIIYQYKDETLTRQYWIEHSGNVFDKKMIADNDEPMMIGIWQLSKKNVFPGFTAIYETKDRLLLNSYDNRGAPSFFVANKATLQGGYYTYTVLPRSSNPVFPIIGASEDMFIAYLESPQLMQWRENMDLLKIPNIDLRKIIQNVSFENNPCLIFYK